MHAEHSASKMVKPTNSSSANHRKTVRKCDEVTECSSNVLDDEVNKPQRESRSRVTRQSRSVEIENEPMSEATPCKKRKKSAKEKFSSSATNKKPTKQVTAQFEEDNDFVTLNVELGEKEFEEGEIEEINTSEKEKAKQPEVGPSQPNTNASANVIPEHVQRVDDAIAEINRQERLRIERQRAKDEEELQVVSKRIAGETFSLVKEMMEQSGILDAANLIKDQMSRPVANQRFNEGQARKRPGVQGNASLATEASDYRSETTIYENTVRGDMQINREERGIDNVLKPNQSVKFNSLLEEETLDTSDETNLDMTAQLDQLQIAKFLASDPSGGRNDGQQPSTSGYLGHQQNEMRRAMEGIDAQQSTMTPEEKAEKLIKEAEAAKARIYSTPGKCEEINKQFHSVIVDEDYLLVASHVDSAMYNKIILGGYVDFARLIPRDRIQQEEEQRLEVVVKGGHTYWVPVEKDSQAIVNFNRWEQAFRVFSDIYLRKNPERSTELIQYNHIIHSISLTYVWDNVYAYDKDFRLHIGRHPKHSWGIILQQAWAMRLKDKIVKSDYHSFQNHNRSRGTSNERGNGQDGSPDFKGIDVNRICRRFNHGRCSFGQTCQFEHRCLYCFKFGHNIFNCRKLKAECDRNKSRRFSDGGSRRDDEQHRRKDHNEKKPQ